MNRRPPGPAAFYVHPRLPAIQGGRGPQLPTCSIAIITTASPGYVSEVLKWTMVGDARGETVSSIRMITIPVPRQRGDKGSKSQGSLF